MVYRSDLTPPGPKAALEALIKERGPLDQPAPVRLAELERLEGKVAPILLDLWDNFGVGDLAGGQLRLCVPFEVQDAVTTIFARDPDFSLPDGRVDVHGFAHTAFGNLFAWSERHWLIHIDVVLGLIDAPFLVRPEARTHPDAIVLDLALRADKRLLDMVDENDAPMFQRAREAHGPLGRMTIYAPGPPVTHDPYPTFAKLYRAPYPDWLGERAISKVWYLSDSATGNFNLRTIGGRG